jgi:hypothetical protein
MSFAELPEVVLGRVGDFLTPLDRARMRETSRANKAIYRKMPAHEYFVRNRFSLIHLQSEKKASTMTTESRLQQYILSSEIGTTNQREFCLKKTSFLRLKERLEDNFEEENFTFLNFLTDDVDVPPPPVGLDWREEKRKKIINDLFTKVVESESKINSLGYYTNDFFSLFSQSELGDLILQRKSFPVTFVRVKEIDLLAYARIENDDGDSTTVKTIDDLLQFIYDNEISPIFMFTYRWLKNVLIARLGGDGDTSIEPLKEFLTFSYIHEIHVEKF